MTTANEVMEPCSDRNCILLDPAKPRGGMHTNGGCEHLSNGRPGTLALLRAMGAEIVRLRALPVIATCGDCRWLSLVGRDCVCTHLGRAAMTKQDETPPTWCPKRGKS